MIRHQFGQVEFASEHWFRLAATTLAGLTRSAGLATPAKPPRRALRRIDLVVDQRADGEPVLVLREGAIKQVAGHARRADRTRTTLNARRRPPQRRCSTDATAAEAERGSRGLDAADARRSALAARVGERIVRILREFDAAAIEEVFSDGLLNVMEAPEFAQSEKLRRVFAALENRAYLGELVGSVAGSGRVRVFIGAENPAEEMRDVSLVLAPYGRPGPRRRRRRRPRADPDGLSPGDRHGPLRVRPDERAGRPPLCLTTPRPASPDDAQQDPRRGAHRRARHLADHAARRDRGAAAPSSTTAQRAGRRVPGRAPARARRVPELQAPDRRGARARRSAWPART